MAVLSGAQRTKVKNALMRYWSVTAENIAFIKADLVTAVGETDVWIDSNEGNSSTNQGYNVALSGGFKTGATAGQKSDCFIFVAAMRRSEDLLKRIFAEID
jgi:hypothetical protein